MAKMSITLGCVAAVAVASFLVIRLRQTRRTPSPLTGREPFGERLAVTVARTGGMLVGAYIGGIFAIGAGGRLLMRILAATSSEDVQGLRTDAEEAIGDVSYGGSMFFILVIGAGAGLAGLAIFATLRRWLPDRSIPAGLIGVAIGAGLLVRPTDFLAPDNRDFTVLDPVVLAVALCVGILVLFGATVGVLVDHLAPRWPRPGWSARGIASVLPFAVLVLSPPLFVVTGMAVLIGAVAPRARSRGRQGGASSNQDEIASRLASAAVTAAGALGAISVLAAAGQILVD